MTRTGRGHGRPAIALAFQTPSLARAELAFGATCIADWAFTIGLGIVAFQDGGAGRVGLVAVLRLAPSALLAPVASALADRWPREHVLAASSGVLAASAAIGALVLAASGPLIVLYALATVSSVALTPYRAAHSALLPSLCRTTVELAAANLTRGLVESVSVIVGPLVAAALIDGVGLWAVFAATAVAAVVAGGLVQRLPYERPPVLAAAPRRTLAREVLDGLGATRASPGALLLIVVTSVQTFLRGGLSVFTVVLVIDELQAAESQVGVLQAAMGFGAVAGSLAAARLVRTRRMAGWFGAAVVMWGLPIALIAARPDLPWAFAMLAVVGVANAVLDVTLFTMLGRLVPNQVLGRVFGVFESIVAMSVAAGSVAAALAVDALGTRGAMVLLGAAAPAAVLVAAPSLARVDGRLRGRQAQLDVLQSVPILAALPVPSIEHLARAMRLRSLAPAELVIRAGTVGSGFYVVTSGAVEVRHGDRLIRTMGPGEGFGEIALLRSVRRTADVRAGPAGAEVYALTRSDFVLAVTGCSPSATEAAAAIEGWAKDD